MRSSSGVHTTRRDASPAVSAARGGEEGAAASAMARSVRGAATRARRER